MERLTERKINKHDVSWVVKNKGYKAAAERLAKYEETGYTPEEIKALKAENDQLITNAARYVTRLFFETKKSEKLKTENEQLQTYRATMREAMEEFCAKVEDGKIRSRGTYLKFVEILNSTKGME